MLWTTGVSRWFAHSKPTFSRIGKRSLEGTLDTSGVSRMVLHKDISSAEKSANFAHNLFSRDLKQKPP